MRATTQRALRRIHLYLGMVFAPAILFFTVTGMLQTFDFHEPENKPAAWLKVAAMLHKKQDFPKPRPPRAKARPAEGPRQAAPAAPRHSPLPLKIFVGLMSLGLIASTLLGIWIALSLRASRRGAVISLAIGTVLPVLLLFV